MKGNNYKIVVFDFDGTLTHKQNNIWKSIWQKLEYDTAKNSYFAEIYCKFLTKEITHQQWCDLTCEKFREKGFTIEMMNNLANSITLLNGVEKTLYTLKANNIQMFILSGNIRQVVLKALDNANLTKYFNESFKMPYGQKIYANNITFDEKSHIIRKIEGTNYDFEGKANFIEELKKKTGLSLNEILYVCDDDCNDKRVNSAYCDILYINANHDANYDISKGPISIINECDFAKILPYILPKLTKDNPIEQI